MMQYYIFWLVSFHFKSTSTNIAGDPTEEGVPPGEPVWDVAFSFEKNSWISRGVEIVKLLPDMEFVKNFTHQDVQAKSFTPQKCVICDSFFSQINSVNASNINNLGIFWL